MPTHPCQQCAKVSAWHLKQSPRLEAVNGAQPAEKDGVAQSPYWVPYGEVFMDSGMGWRHFCADSPVSIILASANAIRSCDQCRTAFSKAFCMPELWWTNYCRKSNGYFGCEIEQDIEGDLGYNTWAFFEVKHLKHDLHYEWLKLNVFTRWITSSGQMAIILFDAQPSVIERITESIGRVPNAQWNDSFWVYPVIFDELVRLEDEAVWSIRDSVRLVELQEPQKGKPDPKYRRLHDIARHAIHVTETLDVAMHTTNSILSHHEVFKAETLEPTLWQNIHHRLVFFRSMIVSLRCRSSSNEKRLLNEIQLAFHSVAQYDSRVSVRIGQATQADSAAMKTVASLTLVFLPPTFMCAIFSMSFFSNGDGGWTISGKFWLYWAFAIPLTVFTIVLWFFWQKNFTRPFIEDEQEQEVVKRRLWDTKTLLEKGILRR